MLGETSFHHNLKGRNTKKIKDDDAEVETGIWDNAIARIMGEEFISERHGIIFKSLRKRMSRRFNNNALNIFIHYMKLTHGLSVEKYSDERESERDKDLAEG